MASEAKVEDHGRVFPASKSPNHYRKKIANLVGKLLLKRRLFLLKIDDQFDKSADQTFTYW